MVSHKMNTFFHAIGTASFSLAVASATLAAPVWETDFNKGLETARAENRPVMVEFTGSDWCPPCKYLRSTILDSPEFANYADKNKLVLVELDFPRTPGKISKELMKEREDIMRRYGVTGFPTVMLMDGTGAPHARIVGPTKTAPEYLEKLENARELKNSLNGEIAAARMLSDSERAAALAKALEKVPEELQGYHKELIAEIMAADPEDRFGYGKKEKEARLMAQQREMLEQFYLSQRGKARGEEAQKSREEAGKILASPDLLPSIRLKLNKFISDSYALERNYPKSLEYLKIARDSDPGSKESARLQPWIENMEKIIAGEK